MNGGGGRVPAKSSQLTNQAEQASQSTQPATCNSCLGSHSKLASQPPSTPAGWTGQFWVANRQAFSHRPGQPASRQASHGWVAGWSVKRPCRAAWQLAGHVVGWLAVWLAGWLAGGLDPKIGSWMRAIQFSEIEDPISDPIFGSDFFGDTSAAECSKKSDQEIGSKIGS